MAELQVIINADDFGLSEGVSRGIVELLEAGALDTTSVMICAGPEVASRTRRYASAVAGRAGVHLQLSSGSPLSPAKEVRSLCWPSGRFVGPDRLEAVACEEVEREWRRQICAVAEALGAPPTHLDSHHGVHRHPLLAPVYGRLAAEFGVPVRERGVCDPAPAGSDLAATDWTGTGSGVPGLLGALEKARSELPEGGVIDLVSHPAYADAELATRSSWTTVRESDMTTLLELAGSGALEAAGFQRTSYARLG